MSEYGWVEEIVINQLSNRALVLVSRFARILKQVNGDRLNLQDPHLAKNVVHAMNETNDPRLKRIFDDLLLEFHVLAEGEELISPKENVAIDVDSVKSSEVRFYRGVPIEPRSR